MGVSITGAVHLHLMDGWALSGSDVQAPWNGVLESVAPFRWSTTGWMPARIGKLSADVRRRHPCTIRKASLMAGSIKRVWALRHQTGAQYSAVEYIRTKVTVHNVVAPEWWDPVPALPLREPDGCLGHWDNGGAKKDKNTIVWSGPALADAGPMRGTSLSSDFRT